MSCYSCLVLYLHDHSVLNMANSQDIFEREKELCELFRDNEEKKVFL